MRIRTDLSTHERWLADSLQNRGIAIPRNVEPEYLDHIIAVGRNQPHDPVTLAPHPDVLFALRLTERPADDIHDVSPAAPGPFAPRDDQ